MVKLCPKCNLLLDENEFNWKYRNKKRASYCKSCSRAYIKSHYNKNIEYYITKAKKRNRLVRHKSRKFVAEHLSKNPCIDCGETNILVLEFDHKDRSDKTNTISKLIKNNSTPKVIKHEIMKCEVRCANCHRKKTEQENNSWKLKYAPVV